MSNRVLVLLVLEVRIIIYYIHLDHSIILLQLLSVLHISAIIVFLLTKALL